MTNLIKIALLQLVATKNDQEANLKKGDLYCWKAKELGADIVLFPEMWNIGYTPFNQDILHSDFTPQHAVTYAEDIKKWQSQAVSLDSHFVQHFRRLAKELNIAIAITYLEKHKNEPRNAVSLIDRKGNVQFTYAKVHTCDFSAEAVCASGDDFYVCDLDTENGNVKIGAMICFDREFTESARVLMLKGAEIILTPNSCEMEENRICQFKTRAMENMVGVALTNYASSQENGHSCAFDGIPFNEDGASRDMCIMIAGNEEGVLIAEFDMEKIRRWRKSEGWGNAFRKPRQYQSLIALDVNEPFIRANSKR
jgi:N-carbamoylputrescine amidase